MYASDTGQLAIGKVTVDAVPEDGESAIIHYAEDTAWLSPTTKTHKIDVFLTGTESASHAKDIASRICEAFVAVKGQGPRVEGQGPRVEGQGSRAKGRGIFRFIDLPGGTRGVVVSPTQAAEKMV